MSVSKHSGDGKRREDLRGVIRPRPRVGRGASVLISLAFALIATPIVMADSWLGLRDADAIVAGESAPVTVRVAQFMSEARIENDLAGGPVVVARGETVSPETAELAASVLESQPAGLGAWAAYFSGLFILALLYSTHMRRSHRGRLARTQIVTLLMLLAGAAIVKMLVTFTAMSPLVVPVAGVAIIATLVVDLSAGLATGLVASVLVGTLVPFDLGVVTLLAVQSSSSVVILGEGRHRTPHVALAGVAGGLVAAAGYVVFLYLSGLDMPFGELESPLSSALLAAFAGGVLSGLAAMPAQPLYQWLLGELTRNKLVELEDLSNPLLKRIASNAPGTWQHSLAMANMAEICANSIGANGRLVRVGAYYHDLGKSLQPKYFIENLEGGETSPHDRLQPDVSCDAIFAHVTEGIHEARKAGLPERVIDFMHMHHGDGLLEYFWAKCQEAGNPNNLTEDDFRYPGIPPQSKETAILAICDAVEAASRTLKQPDERAIKTLVQRIVYGKLDLGQLDESGLTMADLRKISGSLRETIKHAHHGRIEYPWQREQRAAEEQERAAEATRSERPSIAARAADSTRRSATQRIIDEPRLDSLDVPRPLWRARDGWRQIEMAATERLATGTGGPDGPARDDTGDHGPVDASAAHAATAALTPAPIAREDASAAPPAAAALDTGNYRHAAHVHDASYMLDAPAPRVAPPEPAPPITPPPGPTPERADDERADHQLADHERGATASDEPTQQHERDAAPHPDEPAHGDARDGDARPGDARDLAVAPPAVDPGAGRPDTEAAAPPSPDTLAGVVAPAQTAPAGPAPMGAGGPDYERAPTPPPAARVKAPVEVLRELVASARAETASEIGDETEVTHRIGTADPISSEPLEPAGDDTEEDATRGASDEAPRRAPPPPPGSIARMKKPTLELMRQTRRIAALGVPDDEDGPEAPLDDDDGDGPTAIYARAESENDELSPGMLVLGPPPATRRRSDGNGRAHTDREPAHEEPTASSPRASSGKQREP